jgi:hypothetical protein
VFIWGLGRKRIHGIASGISMDVVWRVLLALVIGGLFALMWEVRFRVFIIGALWLLVVAYVYMIDLTRLSILLLIALFFYILYEIDGR